ncbi:uncharacterized protein [Spinacia oleracea]|uniref:Reverse transcriptase domain-containing protein n=1 Tax=Spinacia oleracea TaxID=3562 RepID=A0A9R0JTQ4_SPIOL|nr:uncharacterized protein LOC110786052 [Spinacia oleracea]
MNITRVGVTPWYFTAVYASPDPTKRQELWRELQDFATTHNKPWMIAGDFNDTRFASERNQSCPETNRRSSRFNEWINNMNLIEIEFARVSHTWARRLIPSTRKSARLDRALCNGEWGLRFDKAKVKQLPASQSDHCPIFVSPNGYRWTCKSETNRTLAIFFTKKGSFLHALQDFKQPYRTKSIEGLLNWNRSYVRNLIRFLIVRKLCGGDGTWIHEKEDVKNCIVNYFKTVFTEEGVDEPYNIPQDVFLELNQRDWNYLSIPFTKLDIDAVVKEMSSLKAPGPDGYQVLFYQKNWELVSKNVYELAFTVLEGKGIPNNLNDTHIVLLPKVDNPEVSSQFRPIGLCNVSYKIITKIALVLYSGYSTLNESASSSDQRVIMECVTSTSLKVLWNGEPSQNFTPSRGIQQGDPLSLYLFVMCMERLYQTIEEVLVQQRWKPIRASRDGPLLSNLFFADDIILFAEASPDQAFVIHDCLDRFCKASGQKVSLAKSSVYFSKNVLPSSQEEISTVLGMTTTTDLGLYLGIPTLTSRVTKATFSHLCEKIGRRLTGWKTKYLYLASRITLAKSTISSMSYYSMKTAKLPRSICDEVDKKTRRFIWGVVKKNVPHIYSPGRHYKNPKNKEAWIFIPLDRLMQPF